MPRGRPIDHDKRISQLIGELKEAFAAREAAMLEQRVEQLVRHMVNSVNPSYGTAAYKRLGHAAGIMKPAKDTTETGKKIGSKVKAAWARLTPAERKARIEKMHAWRKR